MRIVQIGNIANQGWGLAQGLRALGHDVKVWDTTGHPFGFPADARFTMDSPAEIVRVLRLAMDEDFDVLHFHAKSLIGQTGGMPMMWDLPVWRALGKKIVFTFHGSEVRKASQHLEEDPWSYFRFGDVACDEDGIEKRLAIIRTYADALIVAGAPLKSFVPEARYVPKVIEVARYPAADGAPERARPMVVHAPSKRATKGTQQILDGIAALQERGLAFDFHLAEGMPHDEFIELYRTADIVVDNLLLGDAEVSALEAMALGKPVITRVRDDVRAAHPDVPVVHADPDSFIEVLADLLADPSRRAALGTRGRAYVEATHDAPVIAKQVEAIYLEPIAQRTRSHPDWVTITGGRKVESLEARIQVLETKNATLTERLKEATRAQATTPAAAAAKIKPIASALLRRARKHGGSDS